MNWYTLLRRAVAPVCYALLMSLALLTAAASQELTDEMKAVLQQAKAEGKVRILSPSLNYPASQVRLLEDAFEKKFGFRLSIEIVGLGTQPVAVQRIRTEVQAGVAPPVDLIPLTVRTLNLLTEVGAIEIVDWAKLGVPQALIKDEKDGIRVYSLLFTVIYNRNLVTADKAPHSYQDLLDPKWRGKLVVFGLGAAFAVMVPVLGEKETYGLVEKLVDTQAPMFVSTAADVRNRVASGEFPIGFGTSAYKVALGDVGVENAILEKISVKPQYAGVIKNTKSPAAAKAVAYFLCCTKEGKDAYYRVVGVSDTDAAGTEAWEIGGEGREVVAPITWQAKDETRVSVEIDKILGVR